MSILYGSNPQAVVQLLNLRLNNNRTSRGQRPRKLALIVEGGGMRGVLSAGSLLAIDLLGYRNCFDEIYATSAGAVNAAYFLSGQGALGITVYFDSINNRKFFNPFRLTKIVDVGYVYDYIVALVKPLDEAAIRNRHTRLYMSVSDVDTGKNVLIDTKTWPDPITQILKASNALPVLYNRTVALNGKDYIDGGITDPLPVKQAIANGCTDILILLTKVRSHVSQPPTGFQKGLFYIMMGRKYPRLLNALDKMHNHSNENRKLAVGENWIDGVNIATICPTESELIISRTTMEREKLLEGAYLLAAKTFRFFSGDMEHLNEVFNRFRVPD